MHIFILASTMYVVGAVAESLAIYQLRKRAAVIEATLGALKDPSGGKRAAGIFRQRVAPKPAAAAADAAGGGAGGSVGGGAGAGLELTRRMAGGEGAAESKYTPGVGQPAAGADGAVEESELDLVTESLGEQAPPANAASAPTAGGADGDAAGSAAGGKGIAAAAAAEVVAAAPRVGCWDCVLSWLTKHLDNVSLVVFPVSYAIVTAALFSTSDEPT